MNSISPYSYSTWQAYFYEWFKERKDRLGRRTSLAELAKRLRLASKGHMHRLLHEPDTTVSPELALRLLALLNLDGKERQYVHTLLELTRARSSEERCYLYGRLLDLRPIDTRPIAEEAQLAYFSAWYHPALRELACHPGQNLEPSILGKRLLPSIPAKRITQSLRTLETLGLLVRQPDGSFRQSDVHVATASDIRSSAVKAHQIQMLRQATQALETLPGDAREFTTLTFSFNKHQLPALKALLREQQQALIRWILAQPQDSAEVFQLQSQLFPMSQEISP